MADKNGNGIDDKLERKPQSQKGFGNSIYDLSGFGSNRTYRPTQYNKPGILGLGEVGNFFTDLFRNTDNFVDSNILGNERPLGGGLGDYRYGSGPGQAASRPKGNVNDLLGGGSFGGGGGAPVQDTPLPSFMDFLKQASSMSQGGFGQVNYDPLRNDARQRGGEYDARLQAMYNQLTNSIRDDGAGIKQNFQGAIDDTAARSADTQQAIQGASNAADNRNQEVLRNLGIEQAQGNIIAGGRDLNSQTADAVSDAAARGQISGDALAQNQQAALTHNTNLAGAAGLEGNLQRARVQSELSSLLAQYDMQEQEANRQAQQQSQSQNMGLANALYEDAWRQRGYNDDVSKWLYEQQNQPQPVDRAGLGLNFVTQLQQQFPDLDISDIVKLVQGIGTAGKLYG